jgi:alkylation response protein AidB-like acyl-CoA dehydrogenase
VSSNSGELSEEQRMMRDSVRAIAQERFAPGAAAVDRSRRPPVENIRELARHGFTGLFIPEEYGGAGLGVLETVLVVEELARACANTAMLFSCTDGATPRAILQIGTEQQKRKYLPGFAKGELLAAWSMSEPNAGSDVGNIQTRAVLDGDHYVVNGTKLWCTAAQIADLFLVLVRLDSAPGMRGVGALLIERDTPGFSIGKHLELLGLRGTGMAELVFEDCRVPASNLLLSAGRMRDLLHVLDVDRITGNPPVSLGAAETAFRHVIEHVRDRHQFGKPLADNQGIQWKLADMAIGIESARALLYRSASRLDRGEALVTDTSIAKTYVNEVAVHVTNEAIQLAGAFGLSEEYPYERCFRDVRGMTIGYGTTEIHRNSIARAIINGTYQV